MNLEITKATRESYGEKLAELGEKNKEIVVLDADLSGATKTSIFAKKFPERFFDMGISEQDMMSTSAGLATFGKIPFASSFAMFAVGRAYDQIRNSISKIKCKNMCFTCRNYSRGRWSNTSNDRRFGANERSAKYACYVYI